MAYAVVVEPFAERHFIKSFAKKYKGAWIVTWKGLLEEFSNFDELFKTNIAETIVHAGDIKICKAEFRVHGTKESRHSSGNRCIVALHADTQVARILLVYSKNDVRGSNETATWKNMIRENYSDYQSLL